MLDARTSCNDQDAVICLMDGAAVDECAVTTEKRADGSDLRTDPAFDLC